MSSFDEDYETATGSLDEFGKRIVGLVEDLLRSNDIAVHSVRHRVKRKESARRKLTAGGDAFASIEDLHDLLGIRIITYFVDHVETVGKLVRGEFEIDSERSTDKSAMLDPDRFGYLSLHYVASVSTSRINLPEWTRFSNLHFEVQIRSILQHSWAEIEHDLGYKSARGIPDKIRRRFSRLAGVLELADDEFKAIRNSLETHAKSVDQSVKAGRKAPLDRDSVISLSLSSPIVRNVDKKISAGSGHPLGKLINHSYAESRAKELRSVGLDFTSDVLELLAAEGPQIARFASEWFTRADKRFREPIDLLSPGISLFYLYLHLEAAKGLAGLDNVGIFRGEDDEEDRAAFLDLHREVFGR
jgi:putative GTP pyrophosphokinase